VRSYATRTSQSSHGLHQNISGLNPSFSSNTQFRKFSTAGRLGTAPTDTQCPRAPSFSSSTDTHQTSTQASPAALTGVNPRTDLVAAFGCCKREAIGWNPQSAWPPHAPQVSSLSKTQASPGGLILLYRNWSEWT